MHSYAKHARSILLEYRELEVLHINGSNDHATIREENIDYQDRLPPVMNWSSIVSIGRT